MMIASSIERGRDGAATAPARGAGVDRALALEFRHWHRTGRYGTQSDPTHPRATRRRRDRDRRRATTSRERNIRARVRARDRRVRASRDASRRAERLDRPRPRARGRDATSARRARVAARDQARVAPNSRARINPRSRARASGVVVARRAPRARARASRRVPMGARGRPSREIAKNTRRFEFSYAHSVRRCEPLRIAKTRRMSSGAMDDRPRSRGGARRVVGTKPRAMSLANELAMKSAVASRAIATKVRATAARARERRRDRRAMARHRRRFDRIRRDDRTARTTRARSGRRAIARGGWSERRGMCRD